MTMFPVLLSAVLFAGADVSPLPDTQADHKRLEEILRRAPFQQWKRREKSDHLDPASFWETLATRFERFFGPLRWIGQQFSSFWQWLKEIWEWWFGPDKPEKGASDNASSLGSLLMTGGWVALVVIVLTLVYMIVRLGRPARVLAPTHILSRHQIRKALETGEALSMSDEGWIDLARQLEAEGDPRAIYRALYLALLSGLHRRGMIDFRLSRTNWYYVDRFRGTPSERETFRELTSEFDEIWYGGRSARVAGVDHVRQQVEKLLAGTGVAHA